MAELVVEQLVKQFGAVRAVNNVSFIVAEGEFLTLLGPSGCGKTTTLSAIAGLERASGGRVVLGNRTFFDHRSGIYLPPEKRDIGLVFQSYALWPHMTVFGNVEFPLKLRKLPRKARRDRVEEVLSLVEMEAYADRFPHALSGGQQQRVALARTLAFRPKLLLLDEPLSNLDAKLRERARSWLRQLQSKVGVTTLYVTHDQAEALALSDRVAVMSAGEIVQLAKPRDLYVRPATAFVADFIGSSNFIEGTVVARGERNELSIEVGEAWPLLVRHHRDCRVGENVTVSVRPEKIRIVPLGDPRPSNNVFDLTIDEQWYLGARLILSAHLGGNPLRVDCEDAAVDRHIRVHIPPEDCIVFPATGADAVAGAGA